MIGAIARWFGYSTWFMLALTASLYWSIPKDDIRRLVQHRASQKLKTKVTIDKIALHGVTGISLLGLQVVLPIKKSTPPEDTSHVPGAPAAEKTPGAEPEAGAEPAAEQPPTLVDMPGLLIANSIRVDVNTFGLLVGQKLKAKLAAEISGGSIDDTTFAVTPDGWALHVGSLDGIDLGPIRVLRTLAKMDLDLMGRLSGKADFEWGGALDASRGEIQLTLSDTVLPYLPIKDPRQPFPIGEAFEVQLGTIELQATLDKSDKLPGVRARPGAAVTLVLDKLSASGEHVELQLDGGQKHTVSFVGKQAGDAEVDITLVVSFTDAFFEWTGVGHRPNGDSSQESHAGLKMALEAGLRSARTVIGQRSYYGFHCQGRLKDFKCVPKAPSRRLTPMTTPSPNPGAGPNDEGHSNEPLRRPSADEGGDDSASARPSPALRPARPGTRPDLPSPRLAQPQPALRPPPRFVEPTRPADDPLEAARARGVTGAPGDTLGPGIGGGTAPPPEPEVAPEPAPEEPVVGEEALPAEPAEAPPEGEEAPAEAVPQDEGVDGADGVDVEGVEPIPEDEVE